MSSSVHGHHRSPDGSGTFCCAPVTGVQERCSIRSPAAIRDGSARLPDKLGSADVLRFCLALDDASLVWVCTQIFGVKAHVLQHLIAFSPANAAPPDVTDAPDGTIEQQASPSQDARLQTPTHGQQPQALQEQPQQQERAKEVETPNMRLHSHNFDRAHTGHDDEKEVDKWLAEIATVTLEDAGRELRETIRKRDADLHGEIPDDLLPAVQFESSMFYATEGMDNLEIGVIRIGDVNQTSSVRFSTKDGSAKAGYKYVATEGVVTFLPGVRLKMITIPLLNDSVWDAEREFCVDLSQDGVKGAVLGRYLWTCRVKLIDDDHFPSNNCGDAIESLDFENLNMPLVMWEFFKMNMRSKVVRTGVLKTLMADLFENSYFMLTLFLNLYMVDFVLCDSCDADAVQQGIIMIVVLRLLPFPVLHFLIYREAFWKVGGATRQCLQSNLLRKYLNYDTASLAHVDESRLVLALTRDSSELASDAFCRLPKMMAALTRLAMLLLYQLIVPIALGEGAPTGQKALIRFLPSLVFPILMVIFLRCRTPITEEVCEIQHQAQNAMILHVRQTIASFELVRDYKKRTLCIDTFGAAIQRFNAAMAISTSVCLNNKMFPSWLSLLLAVGYTQIGGLQVGHGLALGEFLNYLAIFGATGQLWGEIYGHLLSIQNAFDALETVVEYMNLPTETQHRLAQHEQGLNRSREAKRLAVSTSLRTDPCDEISVVLSNVSYQYSTEGSLSVGLNHCSAIFPQGGFYALVGPPSQGKGTILKLLGESLIPSLPGYQRASTGGGYLVVPPHLRVLHVSKTPTFIQDTLLSNLRLGVANGTDDGRLERVLDICRFLRMPEALIQVIEADKLNVSWAQVLSGTESALLHIARALIANPEMLCFHKPELYLNTELTRTTYGAMNEFVQQRGMIQDKAKFYMRRPRTCIVTCRRVGSDASKLVDAVYYVSERVGIIKVPDSANT
eukprot:TRINITY_DN25742_c0_g5_i2.p1 TRINITY_DN25742_c0_g5~~TRINITY_DN25742_c0_g5_i2.p1  ORF type:complete len:958 (+),score=133.43 TRINITY_DN25742_c0_g5_i2:84-2957(+)